MIAILPRIDERNDDGGPVLRAIDPRSYKQNTSHLWQANDYLGNSIFR
jgi:hypothetical protein